MHIILFNGCLDPKLIFNSDHIVWMSNRQTKHELTIKLIP
jgi:hypothetical protein